MVKFCSYLVCKEHLSEVRDFLSQFFEEEKSVYNYDKWITFKVSGVNFCVNLMEGQEQEVTQDMTFKIECDSMEKLVGYSRKYNC